MELSLKTQTHHQNNPNDIHIASLMNDSGVGFGTSGARGLVQDMTDRVCYAYTSAFMQYLKTQGQLKAGGHIGIAGDLRNSTPRIMNAVAQAIIDSECLPVNCGFIPSPAVAYYGLQKSIPNIMVTGSHIPDDRNGIKFNTSTGEILKVDEEGIRAQTVNLPADLFSEDGNFTQPVNNLPEEDPEATQLYINRFLDFFPAGCLAGLKIGLYEHSGVARDILSVIITQLGANLVHLGRSDIFMPVDTEAIRAEDIELAHAWSKEHELDAIVSTDGDADRPLVGDENGTWFRGDIAGILCAAYLNIEHVVTPVSSNTAVELCGLFKSVHRTKIGSPYVISGMQQAYAENKGTVAGYEANGGFLQETPVELNGKTLAALPTRDAVIVILSILTMAQSQKVKISALTDKLPARFTASDRLKNFPTATSKKCIAKLIGEDTESSHQAINKAFGPLCGNPERTDLTDGLRMTFENGEIIHLRPSGNAPEFRCYNEADSLNRAVSLNQSCIKILSEWRT